MKNMKNSMIKRKTFVAFRVFCFIATGIMAVSSTINFRRMTACAMESEKTIGCEGVEKIDGGKVEDESFTENEVSEDFENNMMIRVGREGAVQRESFQEQQLQPFHLVI